MDALTKIIEILKTQNSPISKKKIKELAQCRNQTLIKAIKDLLSSEKITRIGFGKKCSPYLYFLKSSEAMEHTNE